MREKGLVLRTAWRLSTNLVVIVVYDPVSESVARLVPGSNGGLGLIVTKMAPALQGK